jgi:pimeloyl-ACP methyl ester carboxylesterase
MAKLFVCSNTFAKAVLIAAVLSIISIQISADKSMPDDRFATMDEDGFGNGIRIHYKNYGKGKDAIVFIHGWSCDLSFWDANIPAFVGRGHLIAIDLPGHGGSDKPQTGYSMDLFAGAVNTVLKDAGVEKATLIGHSMGTPVSRQFFRKFPAKTSALVVVDGALKPFGTREQMEPMIARFRAPDYKKSVEEFVGFLAQSSKNEKLMEKIRASMLNTPQHVVVGAMEAQFDPAIWKDQDRITVPTLAIMAVNPAWNADYEKFVRELVPGIDYRVWDGVSHFLMMDEPQKFNETVIGFLTKYKLVKK